MSISFHKDDRCLFVPLPNQSKIQVDICRLPFILFYILHSLMYLYFIWKLSWHLPSGHLQGTMCQTHMLSGPYEALVVSRWADTHTRSFQTHLVLWRMNRGMMWQWREWWGFGNEQGFYKEARSEQTRDIWEIPLLQAKKKSYSRGNDKGSQGSTSLPLWAPKGCRCWAESVLYSGVVK